MSSSLNRRIKRAMTPANQRAQRANGAESKPAQVDDVNKAFQQLSQNQEKLAELVNQNFGAVHGAFDLVDGHQHVTRRIINDIVKGEVRLNEDATQGVDYTWYFEQYNACRFVLQFLYFLHRKPEVADAPQSSQEPEAAAPGSDDTVFGGDYATQDSSAG